MITVLAREGCTCPRENGVEPVITDLSPVTVPESFYYTRLLADGSLRLADDAIPKSKGAKS